MTIEDKILETILKKVKESTKAFGENFHCYSFELCFNPLAMQNWFMRFKKADISNPDKIKEEYTFFCFNSEGNMLDCSPIFKKQEDEVLFFDIMIVIKKYARI